MTNFLQETEECLRGCEIEPSQIEFITIRGNSYISWAEFVSIADFEYDDGYGGAEIKNIKIVGPDWWLERHEYDGSEWWEFKRKPEKPNHHAEKFSKEDLKEE